MGRFSIRLKITIWFTAALVVIVLFAYLMIFVVSRQILIKTIQDSLVETVENNVDEIEYFSGMDEIRTDADIDYLIDYRTVIVDEAHKLPEAAKQKPAQVGVPRSL